MDQSTEGGLVAEKVPDHLLSKLLTASTTPPSLRICMFVFGAYIRKTWVTKRISDLDFGFSKKDATRQRILMIWTSARHRHVVGKYANVMKNTDTVCEGVKRLKYTHDMENVLFLNESDDTTRDTRVALNEIKRSYISTMPSGRLAGISVRPLRRQSTMLLLQLQLGGHTATWGTQALDSVCAGPVDRNTQEQYIRYLKTSSWDWL